jgi:hypothetical protein
MIQLPYTRYYVINLGTTNTSGTTILTTTTRCQLFFEPIGSRMECDQSVGIFVDNYFTDTDGRESDPWLFQASSSTGSTSMNRSGDFDSYIHTTLIVPSGKNIRTFLNQNTDRIGGRLHVWEMATP